MMTLFYAAALHFW